MTDTSRGDDLVLAMPRRELYRVSGFAARVALDVLQSVAEESWFATPAAIAADVDAATVHLGVCAVRGTGAARAALVRADGALLHTAPIPSGVGTLGEGLLGIRLLAQAAGARLTGGERPPVALAGYLHDAALPGLGPALVLVYRLNLDATHPAPPGADWVPLAALPATPLDPLSALAIEAL
jgi:hypothetical protein